MPFLDLLDTQDPIVAEKVKQLLADHGISFQIVNEYRLHKENDYGDMLGNATFQVEEHNLLKANHLLISHGLKEQAVYSYPEQKRTRKGIPTHSRPGSLDRIPLRIQLYLFFALVAGAPMLILIVLLFSQPKQEFWERERCVAELIHNKQKLYPNTLKFIFLNGCKESVWFHRDGMAFLPGFSTNPVKGEWKMSADRKEVRIFNTENFSEVYDGRYAVKIKFSGKVELRSERTLIVLSK